MRILALALLATGCDLYLGSSHGAGGPPAPPAASASIAYDCVRSLATGDTLGNGRLALIVNFACADSSRIANVELYDGKLEEVTSFGADQPVQLRRTFVANADARPILEDLGVAADTSAFVIYAGISEVFATRVDFVRPFTELAIADLDGDRVPDVVVAGDGALRVRLGTTAGLPATVTADQERELATGQPFVAVAPIGTQLVYVASDPASASAQIGVLAQTAASPPTYAAGTSLAIGGGSALPLFVGDVDGDGVPDVVGATSQLFVYSSRLARFLVLDEAPRALALGDLDGSGTVAPIFLAGDGASVRRVVVAADGTLTSELALAAGGATLAVGDLDADGRDDVALVDGTPGRAGTTVSVYLSR